MRYANLLGECAIQYPYHNMEQETVLETAFVAPGTERIV